MEKDLILIHNLIYEIRGQKVMLDSDLASLYGITTSNLNKAVKRNIKRFPCDFMFQLTKEEFHLIFQNGISNKRGGRRFMPFVFTEQGVAMLSSVIQSEQAINVNIQIMRTFVKIKQFALEHKDLTKRFAELEHYFIEYCKENDYEIQKINEAINLLLDRTKPGQIGFQIDK